MEGALVVVALCVSVWGEKCVSGCKWRTYGVPAVGSSLNFLCTYV